MTWAFAITVSKSGQTWGENRVFFLDDDATLKSLPTAWTDAAAPDVFVRIPAIADNCSG